MFGKSYAVFSESNLSDQSGIIKSLVMLYPCML